MKRLNFIAMMLFYLVTGLHAQVSGMRMGYCNGELGTSPIVSSTAKGIWVSGAIYVPASMVNTFEGSHIDSIHAGLTSKLNVDTLRVWLRSSLDGDNLAEGYITTETDPAVAKGWNTVGLNVPYNITKSDNGLYIGYSYYQKSTSNGLSAIKTPTENGLYVKIGDGDWTDRSSEGTLSVEALVFGDNLPKINLCLNNVNVPNSFAISKGTMDISGTVENLATMTISGFDVNVNFDGVEDTYTEHVDCSLPIYGKHDFALTIRPDITQRGDGKGHLRVTVSNIAEGNDEDSSDNAAEADFKIVNQDNTRHVLVEEFTTERCPNCPRLAGYIHNALQKEKYKGLAHVVCHHAGFYTDWLTADCDESYLWLYNKNGATFAPAMMVDRYTFGGTAATHSPASQNDVESCWDERLAETAPVSLDITAKIDANTANTMHVTISCEKTEDNFADSPRLTVFVVENNINARNQAGISANFVHQHVTRSCNAAWGEPITWNGNDFEYTCDFTLDDTWVRDNLEIIAFVSNYNPEDATDCAIYNSNAIAYSQVDVSGIGSLPTDNAQTACYYTLSGTKIEKAEAKGGVFIIKQGDTVRKVVINK